jgi:DHA3 family macrolide efflux protein-like MFS transporter
MQLNDSLRKLGSPFLLLWMGSTISMVGTLIVEFALSVWVFQQTGSVLDFSGMLVAATLPSLFILPFAGSFADRFDRRYIMIASDSVAAVMTLILAFLLFKESLQVWHLYVFNFVASISGAFQAPAYEAAASAALSKDQMVRANGLMGASESLLSIFAPLSASALLGIIDLSGIVLLDLVTFCIGTVFVLIAVGLIPSVAVASEKPLIQSALIDFSKAMSFFKEQRLMLGLLVYGAIQNSLVTLASIMITPLVLANHSALELGVVMTWGAVGSLVGSGLLIVKGNSKKLMVSFLICDVILSLCILIAGGINSVGLYSVCAFIAMLAGTAGDGCSGALWMRKVPLESQGRIFALLGTVMTLSIPIVSVLGGFVADHVFEPALSPGGVWAESIGAWLGIGKGLGMRLIFVISGVLGIVVSLSALSRPHFRNVDNFVPDRN